MRISLRESEWLKGFQSVRGSLLEFVRERNMVERGGTFQRGIFLMDEMTPDGLDSNAQSSGVIGAS